MTDPTLPVVPRVLVVDDEALIAMMMEDLLLDLGCAVVGPVGTVAAALELIAGATGATAIDAAFLDINLRGEVVYPVATALSAAGVPYCFVTGYSEHGMLPPFDRDPVLAKPAQPQHIAAMLLRMIRFPLAA